jgi:hemerythrin-like metal-binding protein
MIQTRSDRIVRARAEVALETQHVRLMALGSTILKLEDPIGVREKLIDLFVLAIAHFRDEEDFMSTRDYPNFHEHVEYHRELMDTLSSMVVCFRDEVIDLDRLKVFLREWGRTHLIEHDFVLGQPHGSLDSAFHDFPSGISGLSDSSAVAA